MKAARRDRVVPASRRRRLPMAWCLALFAGLLIHANASAEPGANSATQTEFECVIEPQQIVKLAKFLSSGSSRSLMSIAAISFVKARLSGSSKMA